MSSLDIIKQELINQKNLLEQKGVSVNVTNTNPSPTDITTAISNMPSAGGSSEESALLLSMITGNGSQEIYIPEDAECTTIRPYAYYCYSMDNDELFYKENLTIPSNITKIGTSAFKGANLTGLVTVPATCTDVAGGIFQYSKLTEINIQCKLTSSCTYFCSNCPNLKKATLGEGVSYIPTNVLSYNVNLEEVYLPSTATTFGGTALYQCSAIKLVKFKGGTPLTISTGVFKYCPNAVFLVPYEYYYEYFTATNYQYHGNTQYGYGEFNTGDALPSTHNNYLITWYATFEDAQNGTNAVTTCPATGTMYGTFVGIYS